MAEDTDFHQTQSATAEQEWTTERVNATGPGSGRSEKSGPEPNGAAQLGNDVSPAFSDDYLALKFTARHAHELRYVAQWFSWLKWSGTRWEYEKTLHVFDLARRIAREYAAMCNNDGDDEGPSPTSIASARTVSAIERLARSDRHHAATAEIWDLDIWLLNTPTGVVELKTGKLLRHDEHDNRGKYLIKQTAAGPDGECQRWLNFLSEVTDGNEDSIAYLQRLAGYTLTGEIKEHAWFFFWGEGGNGKGVFINTISRVMGDYAANAPIETFIITPNVQHPADLASFRGARIVTSQETEKGQRWAEAKIKRMTGGDEITARFMRQNFFTYMPQFKLWLAGNHKPSIGSVDQANKRRANLVPFTVKITDPDKDLPEKLKAEWSGILAWAVQGCLEWQRIGLAPPDAVREETEEYLADQDTLSQWIDDCCLVGPNNWGATAELWASFQAWATRRNEKLGTQRAFSDALMTREGIQGGAQGKLKGTRGFWGISVRRDDPPEPPPEEQPY